MNPLRMWVGGATRYSSNQMLPHVSVTVTPPSVVDRRKVLKARSAAPRYLLSLVSRYARTSSEIPCPCASAEYHGAFNRERYSQSKWWFHTQDACEFCSSC